MPRRAKGKGQKPSANQQMVPGSEPAQLDSTPSSRVPELSKTNVSSITQPAATPAAPSPLAAFISGHIDITPEEFAREYAPALDKAISEGYNFVIGDARGVDTAALSHLLTHGGPGIEKRISIFPSRAYNIPKFEAQGLKVVLIEDGKVKAGNVKGSSRAHHLARDARLTEASDFDILWVRGEEECRVLYGEKWRPRVSATEYNRLRRLEIAAAREKEGIEGARGPDRVV